MGKGEQQKERGKGGERGPTKRTGQGRGKGSNENTGGLSATFVTRFKGFSDCSRALPAMRSFLLLTRGVLLPFYCITQKTES